MPGSLGTVAATRTHKWLDVKALGILPSNWSLGAPWEQAFQVMSHLRAVWAQCIRRLFWWRCCRCGGSVWPPCDREDKSADSGDGLSPPIPSWDVNNSRCHRTVEALPHLKKQARRRQASSPCQLPLRYRFHPHIPKCCIGQRYAYLGQRHESCPPRPPHQPSRSPQV